MTQAHLVGGSSAELSDCGRYRFRLDRWWADGARVAFLMLNPSTADADSDDPTLRRCMRFAQRWGYPGVTVVNLWPLRTPHPAALWAWMGSAFQLEQTPQGVQHAGLRTSIAADALGALLRNSDTIRAVAAESALRIIAFGNEAAQRQPEYIRERIADLGAGAMCLGTSEAGWPKHPLARGRSRVPDTATPQFWQWPQPSTAA